jgi:hypothetical protein
MVGGRGKLCDEELRNLYFSWSIIRMIMPRMRWSVHVAWMGRGGATDPEWKRPLGRPGFKWILDKYDGVIWTELIWLRRVTNGRLL